MQPCVQGKWAAMSVLHATPVDYVRSLGNNRFEGGSILFAPISSSPPTARFVDLTTTDISAFATVHPTRIALTVTFADDGSSQELWAATTSPTSVGVTLAKALLDAGAQRRVARVRLTSSRPETTQFFIWSGAITLLTYRRPIIALASNQLRFGYPGVAGLPASLPMTISNVEPGTGPLQWYVSSSRAASSNNIPGLTLQPGHGNSQTLTLESASHYAGRAFVHARTLDGALAIAPLDVLLASDPIVSGPASITCSLADAPAAFPMTVAAPGTGPLTWWLEAPVPSGVTIDAATGVLRLAPGNYTSNSVDVRASNVLGAAAAHTILVHAAQRPSVFNPVSIRTNTSLGSNFVFSGLRQTAPGTGPITWSISDAPGLSLHPITGLMTFAWDAHISRNVSIAASNAVGGASTQEFFLQVLPRPVLRHPGPIEVVTADTAVNFAIEHTTPGTIPLTWLLQPLTPGVAITQNGVLRFSPGYYTDTQLTVKLSNELGAHDTMQVPVLACQRPTILPPSGPLRASMTTAPYTYLMSQVAAGTGPLAWRIDPQVPGVSVDSIGQLTVASNTTVIGPVRVVVANRLGAEGSATLQLHVTQSPLLPPTPLVLSAAMSNGQDFTHQLSLLTAPGPELVWSVRGASPANVSVTSSGLLRVRGETTANTQLVVSASNVLDGSEALRTLSINVAQHPVIDWQAGGAIAASFVQGSDQRFQHPVVQLYRGTGPLTWSVQGPGGLTIHPVGGDTSNALLEYGGQAALRGVPFTLRASNARGDVHTITSTVTLLPRPIINTSAAVSSITESLVANYTYTIPLTNPVQAPSWYWVTAPTTGALTLDGAAGVLVIASNAAVSESVVVGVSNELGAGSTLPIRVRTLATPRLTVPSMVAVSASNGQPFTYPVTQLSEGTGLLTWSINRIQNAGISISDQGVVTVPASTRVDASMTVTARNSLGGMAFATFGLQVVRPPLIVPPPIIRGSTTADADFTYQMTQQEATSGPVTWFAMGAPVGVTVTHDGRVVASRGQYITGTLGIGASNALGGTCNVTLPIEVAHLPSFDTALVSGTMGSNVGFAHQFSNVAAGTGGVTWSAAQPSPVDPSLSVSSAGILSVAPHNYVDRQISVSASNAASGVFSRTVRVRVAQETVLVNPGAVACNLPSGVTGPLLFTLPISQTATGTGPLAWTVVDAVTAGAVPNVSITQAGIIGVSGAVMREVSVRASNVAGSIASVRFPLNVAVEPRLRAPPSSLSSVNTPYPPTPHHIPVVNESGAASGQVTWSLAALDGSPIEGLVVSQSGVLTVAAGASVGGRYRVSASNTAGGACNIDVDLSVRPMPSLLPTSTVRRSRSNADELFAHQVVQRACNVGPITWGIAGAGGAPLGAVSVDADGIVRVDQGQLAQGTYTVSASNAYGGVATQALTLDVAQTPSIDHISDVELNLTTSAPYVLQAVNTQSNTGPVAWSVVAPQGVSISAATGLISVGSNSPSVNGQVIVSASNTAGGVCNAAFLMRVSQTPHIADPGPVRASRVGQYAMALTQTASRANPVTWGLASPGAPGVSIDAATGVLTVQCNVAVVGPVAVWASNILGVAFSRELDMEVLANPVVINPGPVDVSLGAAAHVITMSQAVAPSATGPLSWSIEPELPGLDISPTTGSVTVQPGSHITADVTVAAQNALGGSSSATFRLRAVGQAALTGASVACNLADSDSMLVTWFPNQYTSEVVIADGLSNTWQGIAASNVSYSIPQSSLLPNTTYSFTVTPRNILGELGPCNATPPLMTLPSAVAAPTRSEPSSNSVLVSWGHATYAASVSVSLDGAGTVVCPVASLGCNIDWLAPNTQYELTVQALNGEGVAGSVSTLTPFRTLAALASVATSNVTSSGLHIAWAPVPPDSRSYSNVLVGVHGSTPSVVPYPIASFPVTGLQPNASISLDVTPFNDGGVPGTPVTLTARTAPAIGNVGVVVSGTDVTLSWGAASSSSNYAWADVSWTGPTPGLVQNITSGSITLSMASVGNDATYVVSVRPYNADGVAGVPDTVTVNKRGALIVHHD